MRYLKVLCGKQVREGRGDLGVASEEQDGRIYECQRHQVEQVVGNAERFCQYAGQEIELTDQPRILSLRAELALLAEQEDDLKTRLRQAPPPGDVRSRRRKAAYYWAVTFILTLAGFFFSLLAFAPFRLGPKGYLYYLGIAVITPFSVEKFLEVWGKERLLKAVTNHHTYDTVVASALKIAVPSEAEKKAKLVAERRWD